MAVQYSYEDFEKAAKNAGLLGQFSQADLSMAQENPNFGMSILGLKQNWQSATTDEQRQQINDQANQLRSSYGNYTGGADGNQYISTGKLNNDIDAQMEKISGYAPFSYDTPAPTFDWSKENDPQWSAYKKEYLREGDRAAANALAQASAASGGQPSSFALTAAGQAGDYYAAQLADKIPELYQQAYEQYLNELNQYNTDRSFAYNDYLTQYNMLQDQLAKLQGQQQTEFDQNLTVQQYQDQLAQYQDALKQQAVENALAASQVFGYVPGNGAEALGVAAGTPTAAQQQYNDSLTQWQQQFDFQQQQYADSMSQSQKDTLAGYGQAFLQQGVMPSAAMLAAMGITEADAQNYIAALKAQQAAQQAADAGDSGMEDVYSKLLAAGAKDYGTAYAMLVSSGYSAANADVIADYFGNVYYPANTTGTGDYKTLKYADLSAEAKKISDLMDSELTTNYAQVLNMIELLKDESEQNYLLTQLKAYLK